MEEYLLLGDNTGGEGSQLQLINFQHVVVFQLDSFVHTH